MNSGSGTRGVLKLKGTPKMLQKWQAYSQYRQTYDKEWKTTIEKVWTDYKSQWDRENPSVTPPKKRFDITNEFIREAFNNETAERVQEVDKYRKKIKEESAAERLVNDEEQNATYQA
jgi:Mg2+ and Co2+ transporter CorA